MPISHTVSETADACTVHLVGELDMAEIEAVTGWLKQVVDACTHPVVEVDLAETIFLDSTGLSGLIRVYQYAHGRGVELRCVNPRPWLRRIFDLAGVSPYFGL
ncbi:STAS domain-containing protein [Catellatospora sp. KI3]|uniref:STAS domain-containing protein n=1 Tax=Catellatospora sp. KI3 TaxID=3041620 RepID=UPI0024826C8D|nr:STAS domain-containing protein [Catellatospora sp. KI3]MDI1461186.1 STAS domain-containing protein [Catellatospora sp. KI3]